MQTDVAGTLSGGGVTTRGLELIRPRLPAILQIVFKKILFYVLLLVVASVLVEIASLLRLKGDLASYAAFWKRYPATGAFTYVALGDSAAQGIGASKPELGYVGLLADQIAHTTSKKVRIVNLSVSGATISDVIRTQLPELKQYKPDLITLDIGSNDIARHIPDFEAHYEALAQSLPKGTVIANIPYFGGRVRKNTQAVTANMAIANAAQAYNLHLVDLQTITKQRQSIWNYAPDLFHPSNRGYKNWDNAFWQVVKPLVS